EWRVTEAMVSAVERRWHEPDHGLWEARLPPRHHVYPKVMCWLTVDRALQLLRVHGGGERADWVDLRDRIGAHVLEQCWGWDGGLPGGEGGFHVCSAWMIEAYLRTGRRADAEELFDQMLDCAGPTGLLPEQYDPQAERGLGNHPQAYSHLGLIRCALLLDGSLKE